MSPRDRSVRAIKGALLRAGHYRRVLARTAFPGVAVLGYHGVRADDSPAGTMAFENLHVRAATFAAHCRVVRSTCDPISLDDWRAALDGKGALPERPVLITFDDGYRSVLTIAAPILAKHGLPAVVFACTEPMQSRRLLWFDHVAATYGETAVEAAKARSYTEWAEAYASSAAVADDDPRALMTPAEIGDLARRPGIEIGAHSARHPILSQASNAQQIEEIASCRDALIKWTGKLVRAFAYPNGRPRVDYTAETVAIVHALGFDVAFTTRPGFAAATEPPLERSRFVVVSEVSAAELAHRLARTWPR